MHYRALILITATYSLLNAQLSFLNFHNICDDNKSCLNDPREIKLIQKFLNIGKSRKLEVNGRYTIATKDAIIKFQKENNLPATGYIGAKTRVALEKRFLELKSRVYRNRDRENTNSKLLSKTLKSRLLAQKSQDNRIKITINSRSGKLKRDLKSVLKSIRGKRVVGADRNNINQVDRTLRSSTSISRFKSFDEFKRVVDLKKSYRVYKDINLLKRANRRNTILKINVSNQRVNLLVNGKVALSSPCTTGAKRKFEPNTKTYRDKRTPLGTFKIMEKIPNKRSNIFGTIYVNGRAVFRGDRRKYRGPKGRFVGHPLKKWMRLTSEGIGLHASKYVKRYPGSNGCIRLPYDVANIIFSKVTKGTKVIVKR